MIQFLLYDEQQPKVGLAIPLVEESYAWGGSAWPGGSPGETSGGRLLVMWLGIYTFMGSRIGRAGTPMNAAASPSPLRCFCKAILLPSIVS
jgi:hypothetical protein